MLHKHEINEKAISGEMRTRNVPNQGSSDVLSVLVR
jgi:hypothetical protein